MNSYAGRSVKGYIIISLFQSTARYRPPLMCAILLSPQLFASITSTKFKAGRHNTLQYLNVSLSFVATKDINEITLRWDNFLNLGLTNKRNNKISRLLQNTRREPSVNDILNFSIQWRPNATYWSRRCRQNTSALMFQSLISLNHSFPLTAKCLPTYCQKSNTKSTSLPPPQFLIITFVSSKIKGLKLI